MSEAEVERLRAENEELKARLNALESANANSFSRPLHERAPFPQPDKLDNRPLSNEEIKRYSRQLIINEFGIEKQRLLRSSSVLLIGAGGLGSPCALYLAGAGVGRLGIIDYDVVEKSNLHRQVIHSEKSIDTPKSASARDAISNFNSDVEVIAYNVLFNSSNAFDIMRPYDIIVDCSDNAVTRYLINDACILLKKPLVSGAALRLDGQLTVYGYGETCPCYRCLFPTPPPREAQGNCSDQGVLGVVPGIIGSLQALEVIKIAAQMDGVLAGKLLTFDASTTTVRTIKLRPRNKNCAVCGESPTIKELIDYEFFCQAKADDKPRLEKIIDDSLSITVTELKDKIDTKTPLLLVDVRPEVQFKICSLDGSINVPLADFSEHINELRAKATTPEAESLPIYVVCRRGNDSQEATKALLEAGHPMVRNIDGGLLTWTSQIDPNFPVY